MTNPSNLRLPTPGCYANPDRSGLTATDVFDGMTEHLFFTLISFSGLDIGLDRGSPVGHYRPPFEFTGTIERIHIAYI